MNLMETRTESDIEQSTRKLLQDLKKAVRNAEELLKEGAEDEGENDASGQDELAAALEVARETQRRLQERAAAGAQVADRIIRQHPYESMGAAFALGALIGVLAARG